MSAIGEAMTGILAFKAGMEAGARELRLRKAVAEAARFLRDHPDTQDVDAEDVARELELSYAEARPR